MANSRNSVSSVSSLSRDSNCSVLEECLRVTVEEGHELVEQVRELKKHYRQLPSEDIRNKIEELSNLSRKMNALRLQVKIVKLEERLQEAKRIQEAKHKGNDQDNEDVFVKDGAENVEEDSNDDNDGLISIPSCPPSAEETRRVVLRRSMDSGLLSRLLSA
mmetsp:Transcript_3544/g.4727  ORF Transcript_3544/g.4727 Transcript_3544/m.4727 type:complete len:161 (-) Transcript_3544:322-804(-)